MGYMQCCCSRPFPIFQVVQVTHQFDSLISFLARSKLYLTLLKVFSACGVVCLSTMLILLQYMISLIALLANLAMAALLDYETFGFPPI